MREPRVYYSDAAAGWLVEWHQGMRPEVLAAVVSAARRQIKAHLESKFDSTNPIRVLGLKRLAELTVEKIKHNLVPRYDYERDRMTVDTETKPRLLGPAYRKAA